MRNECFWQDCNQSEVEHLIRDGSDHTPLYVACKTDLDPVLKPFRFLNFWASDHSFEEEVKRAWEILMEGTTFKVLHNKLKNVKKALCIWSKNTYGDFFKKNATWRI